MERIASLIEQLHQAYHNKADAAQLLVLTNLIQAELQKQMAAAGTAVGSQRVAVVLPGATTVSKLIAEPETKEEVKPLPVSDEKTVEVLQVNEDEVEAELEEIRQKAAFAQKMQAKQAQFKPGFLFEEEEEVEAPTLLHQPDYKPPVPNEEIPPAAPAVKQKEVNEIVLFDESPSINEQLKAGQKEVAHKLNEAPVKDLKKAIGINDRFVFINELFRGDETMYERSIKTINNFTIYPEAQYWMERELKIKLGWNDKSAVVQDFYSLVKRRFT